MLVRETHLDRVEDHVSWRHYDKWASLKQKRLLNSNDAFINSELHFKRTESLPNFISGNRHSCRLTETIETLDEYQGGAVPQFLEVTRLNSEVKYVFCGGFWQSYT